LVKYFSFWKNFVLFNILKNSFNTYLDWFFSWFLNFESWFFTWILNLESWSSLFLNLDSWNLFDSWFFGIIKIILEGIASTESWILDWILDAWSWSLESILNQSLGLLASSKLLGSSSWSLLLQIELSLMHLSELSHWTSFVVTMIILFVLVWWIGLMFLILNFVLLWFYFVFVFLHSSRIAYNLFEEIPPFLFISEWMLESYWIIFLSST